MTDNNTPNTAQQENTTQPEGNGPAGKMFTQEEVNNIVRERLNRVKAGAAEQDERATALDEREAAVQQREQAMQQKESRAACEDHCKAKGYDTVIVDTAGRLAVDEQMMNEIASLKAMTQLSLTCWTRPTRRGSPRCWTSCTRRQRQI